MVEVGAYATIHDLLSFTILIFSINKPTPQMSYMSIMTANRHGEVLASILNTANHAIPKTTPRKTKPEYTLKHGDQMSPKINGD